MTHIDTQNVDVDVFDIVSRHKRSRVGVASPNDFKTSPAGTLSVSAVLGNGLAYCVDLDQRGLLYTLCDEVKVLFSEPFLYFAQYERASRLAFVPLCGLDPFLRGCPEQPLFILSPGRCGSTLLARLLTLAGVQTASEPDLMTQIAAMAKSTPNRPLSDKLQRACLASLAIHCGDQLAVKLRSQCNGIAGEVARVFPGAQFVFILREPLAWARSRYRAFGGNPRSLAHMYHSAVNAYDRVAGLGRAPFLLWYDDIVNDPLLVLRELSFRVPLRLPGPEAVAQIIQTDSQHGSWLASSRLPHRSLSSKQAREFSDEYNKFKSSRARDHRTAAKRN